MFSVVFSIRTPDFQEVSSASSLKDIPSCRVFDLRLNLAPRFIAHQRMSPTTLHHGSCAPKRVGGCEAVDGIRRTPPLGFQSLHGANSGQQRFLDSRFSEVGLRFFCRKGFEREGSSFSVFFFAPPVMLYDGAFRCIAKFTSPFHHPGERFVRFLFPYCLLDAARHRRSGFSFLFSVYHRCLQGFVFLVFFFHHPRLLRGYSRFALYTYSRVLSKDSESRPPQWFPCPDHRTMICRRS